MRRVLPAPTTAMALLLALTAAACNALGDSTDNQGGGADEAGGDSGDDGGEGAPPAPPATLQCSMAEECVPVSSTCCECPTFAVPIGSDLADACGQVDCEPPAGCPLVEAACADSQCQLRCQTLVASNQCERGFARDSFGCLVDECRAADPLLDCTGDVDCIEVQADCCGCESGGADTAIAATARDEYIASLDCREVPACPGVNVCDSSLAPRCIAQTCVLAPALGDGGEDDGASPGDILCGRNGDPACPEGQVCVLNHPEAGDATRLGLGTCQPE